jgi:hypothetical protein
MGMALEESIEGLEKLEANGIDAYIDSGLYEMISRRGDIYVDFRDDHLGGKGFRISIKRTADEKRSCG